MSASQDAPEEQNNDSQAGTSTPAVSDQIVETSNPVEPHAQEAAAFKETPLEEAPEAQSKPRTICGVCEAETAKYKCSRCPLAYCSVACSRTHRENHPPDEPKPPPPLPPAPLPEVVPVNTHPFAVLDNSSELRRLFAKYPKLPARLRRIHEATLPPRNNGSSQGNPLLRKLGGATPTNQKKEVWNTDVGLRKGQAALRKARTDPTEDGDGVREYCELVLHLLSQAEKRDVTAIVRQEVADDNAELIKQLLQSDSIYGDA